jgi:5-methylcytosine-specific restriction endonuclease McrA
MADRRAYDHAYYQRNRDRIIAQVREYRAQNQAAIRARKRRYYQKNRQKILAAVRVYADTNKPTVLQRRRDHYQRHGEHERARNQQYRQEHLDQVRAMNRTWSRQDRAKHPEKSAAHQQTRRARQRGVFVETVSVSVLYARDRGHCGLCPNVVLRKDASIDHIVPLSLGGEHSYRNTHLAHLRCNRLKGNRSGGQLRLLG